MKHFLKSSEMMHCVRWFLSILMIVFIWCDIKWMLYLFVTFSIIRFEHDYFRWKKLYEATEFLNEEWKGKEGDSR